MTEAVEGRSPGGTSRRDFLKKGVLGGGAIVGGYLLMRSPLIAALAPADTTSPGRQRRWTMLIDLRRCDGCGDCTTACRTEHNVPLDQVTQDGGTFYLPRPCMHCENAPCVKVCPVGATYRSPDGLVVIDENRCIGCRYCIAACPYDARYFNWETPTGTTTSPIDDGSLGHTDHTRGIVEKCMFCAHRIEQGRLPACVEGCPMKAIYFGDANEDFLSNGPEMIRLSQVLSTQDAFRWKEELGTEPRVYYLPARR